MASLIQQTARCIFFRNFNIVRTIAVQQRSFHAISCAPKVSVLSKVNIDQQSLQFQSLKFSTKDLKEIEKRVMKVIGDYDKVSADKLSLSSHFIQDLGLDSLDHVEVIMAMEDEFGFEIPDNEAERLARPSDIIKYISEKEDLKE